MSNKTTEGWVEAISPKPNKDYIGIKLDNDEWFNGNNDDIPSMSKGDHIEIEHEDGWVNKINILEEDNEDGQSRTKDSDGPTGGKSTGLKPLQPQI